MKNIVRPSIQQLEQYRRHGLARIDLGILCLDSFIDSNVIPGDIPPKEGFIDGSYLEGAVGFWAKGGKSNFTRLLVFSERCESSCLPLVTFPLDQNKILKGFDYCLEKTKGNIYIPVYEN